MNTQSITLDVSKQSGMMPVIRIGQGDKNGTTIEATIYDNGSPLSLSGYSVRFEMRLPDGTSYYQSSNGTISGNVATIPIDETYAGAVDGITKIAYIVVYSSTVECSTNRINVVVFESAEEGADAAHAYESGIIEATERAIAAAEAAEGVVLQDVPLMSPTIRGGAQLGDGLSITDGVLSVDGATIDLPTMAANVKGGAKLGGSVQTVEQALEIKLVDSASGESVTAASASYLNALTVHGKAVQDGTPTPDAPVPVQVVEGKNILPKAVGNTISGVTFTVNEDGSIVANGTSTARFDYAISVVSDGLKTTPGNYILSGVPDTSGPSTYWIVARVYNSSTSTSRYVNDYNANGVVFTHAENEIINRVYIAVVSGVTFNNVLFKPQIERGSQATPYAPYGSIGINVNGEITPIDLQGNVLASLPDGTRDELVIDSAGKVTLEDAVGYVRLDGNADWREYTSSGITRQLLSNFPNAANSTDTTLLCTHAIRNPSTGTTGTITITNNVLYINLGFSTVEGLKNFLLANDVYVLYKLATPQTIDLGYIDPPAIPSGSAISISASLTPMIDATWWTEKAAPIPEALKAYADSYAPTLDNTDSSIAPIESGVSSANYAIGSYLMMGNVLYKVTTAIAAGETIAPGTNVSQTTVMAEMAALS